MKTLTISTKSFESCLKNFYSKRICNSRFSVAVELNPIEFEFFIKKLINTYKSAPFKRGHNYYDSAFTFDLVIPTEKSVCQQLHQSKKFTITYSIIS